MGRLFNKNLYVDGNSGQKVTKVAGKTGQIHYSRVPDSVLHDGALSCTSRCIFAVLAGAAYQGSTAKIGHRRIATKLGINRETVGDGLQELRARGHIVIIGEGRARRSYLLTSPLFGSKQRAGVKEIGIGPSGTPRLVSAPVAAGQR